MIAYSPDVSYVHEPFSVDHHPGIFAARVPYWFLYVTKENQDLYYEDFRRTLGFRYRPVAELRAIRKPRHATRLVRDGGRFMTSRLRGTRTLIKDPLAFFAAEWLAQSFAMQVVVLIRHPAAFAASWLRLGYRHPFEHFLEQPALMRDHLEIFEPEIRTLANANGSPLAEAALLWRILASTFLTYQERHPGWFFTRYEDLCQAPNANFRALFDHLGLEFTPNIQTRLTAATKPNLDGWRSQLSLDEVKFLRDRVEELSERFYPTATWTGFSRDA